MVDDEVVDEFIAHCMDITHYASPFYDPVKAHEYYLRRRQLKGRHSTKGFSKKQKEAWDYIKNQVKQKKVADTKKARTARDTGIAQARARAKVLRASIATRLTGLANTSSKQEREKIANDLKAVIAKYRAKYKAAAKTAQTSATRSLDTEYKNVKKKVR